MGLVRGKTDRARERLPQHATERVDVAAAIDPASFDGLGREVVDGPEDLTGLGRALGDRGELRQPEVREVRVLAPARVFEQDVGGLHVSVHEAMGVRLVEGVRHLSDDPDRAGRRERAAGKQLREVGPFHVAHREEEEPVGLAHLVHGEHVRVLEGSSDLRLAPEPALELVVAGELGRD